MKTRLYHIVTEAFRVIDVVYEIKAIIWRFSNKAIRQHIISDKNCHFISWYHLWSCAFKKNHHLLWYAHLWVTGKLPHFTRSRDFFRKRFADRSRKWWTSSAKLRRAIANGDCK